MDPYYFSSQSTSTVLSSMLSAYLLTDKTPFLSIESNAQVLHKWNTRVSSLIQSKSAESRYWGVCLVKASGQGGGEGVGHAVGWPKLFVCLLNVFSRERGLIVATGGECVARKGNFNVNNNIWVDCDASGVLEGPEFAITHIFPECVEFGEGEGIVIRGVTGTAYPYSGTCDDI